MLNKKKFFLTVILLSLVVLPSHIFAKDGQPDSVFVTETETHTASISPDVTTEVKISEPVNTRGPEIKATIHKQREDFENQMKEKRTQLKDQFEQKRQEFMNELKQKRDELKDEFQASREAFIKNLQTIKDERKKQILTNVDTVMKNVNKKQTDQLSTILARLTNVLNQLVTKGAVLKTNGTDTSSFDTTVASAKDAISKAQQAVTEQSSKTYSIDLSSQDALKTSVGSTRTQMQSDMQTVRQLVINAKEAVIQAARELSKLKKEHSIQISGSTSPEPSEHPEASVSGTTQQ